MIAQSRFQPLDQLDDASNNQPADLTMPGSSQSALPSDPPANDPAIAENQVSPHLFADRHAPPEHTPMDDQASWTVVQNRKLPRPKPPTTLQPQTLFETIMMRPKAFNITQVPPYQFAYRLRLALPQLKGSDIQCRILMKSNLAVVDCYTEQAAHLLLNLEHIIIDNHIVQFNTYVALREGRIRGVIHRIKGLTQEQLMQGLTSSTHEIVSARPLGMSNTALITFNGTNLPEYVAFESVRFPVHKYRPKITSCMNCLGIGHRADVCTAPKRDPEICARCHTKHAADFICTPKCIHCNGPHDSRSTDCPKVAAATAALRKRVNKPYKPAALNSSPHRYASGKKTQKTQQSQEHFPPLTGEHQTPTPQTHTQAATHPPTQVASAATNATKAHNAPSLHNTPCAPQTHPSVLQELAELRNTQQKYLQIINDQQKTIDELKTVIIQLKEQNAARDAQAPALQAQNERLKLTNAGRTIRNELGLSNEDLPQILPTIPPWEDITVTDNRPLPKHLNQASDKERRDYYAQRHIQFLKSIPADEDIIYTDASCTLEGSNTGAYLNLRTGEASSFFITHSCLLPEAAEGHAISEALAHYTQPGSSPKAVHIFTDSQQVIQTLQARSKIPAYARRILNYAAQLQQRSIRVRIHWIPGHTNIPGNDLVHQRALQHHSKEQLEDDSSKQTATPFQDDTYEANYRAKVLRRRKLRAKLEEATKHNAPPPGSIRLYEITMRRLQTQSFTTIPVLHKMYPTTYCDPNCVSCQVPATMEHILWECPIHESSRAAFTKRAQCTLPQLRRDEAETTHWILEDPLIKARLNLWRNALRTTVIPCPAIARTTSSPV
ncbi:hypothetical protein HPB50_012873 [Hyalomma asiaticum]|uniref:Uncharacterized protein n=1 Tax=Hyalomma asiaticum TaxID=266040 RepID=A0ACB7TND4_HYAAI|nr:hypothetical protein HPB50_012873 [Hyalomma asiaticum]